MTRDEQLDEYARPIREMIATIQRDYYAQLEPWLKRLAELEALRTRPPLVVWAESQSKREAP